jgi:thioredoxin reductase
MERVETVIIGGGPAGSSAALVLGRCRRRVVLFDSGQYRNAHASQVRGFLTRDGTPPGELRELARAELVRYPSVEIASDTVLRVEHREARFAVTTASGRELIADTLLIATGITDTLPDVPGARELQGDRLIPCAYCDGWELRDQPLAVYTYSDERGARFANAIAQWSQDVLWLADAPPELDEKLAAKLLTRGVIAESRRVVALVADGDGVRIEFDRGPAVWRRAVFYHLGCAPGSDLAASLGARLDERRGVEVGRHQQTWVSGLFAAGDVVVDALQAIVAAGQGSSAAIGINEYLTDLP